MTATTPFAAAHALMSAVRHWLSPNIQPDPALQAYAGEVRPLLMRAQAAYEEWVSRDQTVPDNETLANLASRERWQLARAYDGLSHMVPPVEGRRLHRQTLSILSDGIRATQLLGQGYRSTTYTAVCDGEALFEDTHQAIGKILDQLARWDGVTVPKLTPRRLLTADQEAVVG
jgi:hypothetical protein